MGKPGDGVGVFKHITSSANIAVREAARLRRKRHRYKRRLFLTEGEDLLDSALMRSVIPRQVFVLEGEDKIVQRVRESAAAPGRPGPAVEILTCSREVLDKLSELGSSSRVAAVFQMPDLKFPGRLEDGPREPCPYLYLAGAGDPGNVGTLIRSAAALGADAVLLGPETADPYSSKSLRATMGAVFQLPLYLTVNPEALASWAERAGIGIVCADAHAGEPVWRASLEGSFVLVMGSEREGIPRRLIDAAASTVRIPQSAAAESLNVAMAGTAILYEALRQRSPGRQ
ncbi:MAG: RNA methyltransferase [Thermoleophilia bacterium]|nr:RNA methyltransferase [Thermoleophilia bacterium]